MEHHLSIEESIRFGWEKTRTNSRLIFQVVLTLFAVQIAEQVVTRVLGGTLEGAIASAALMILSVVLGIGFTIITLRIAQGKSASYEDILPSFQTSVSYIGAVLLAGIVTAVPLLIALILCLIAYVALPNMAAIAVCSVLAAIALVVAVYLMLRYVFVRFAILEDGDIVKSLRTSAHLTAGRKWWLVGFFIVVGLLNLLGVILLMVGLLVTIPVTMLAMAHVYTKLRAHHS
jgi:hypothetical protein